MFPTRVGMNRSPCIPSTIRARVPHASGDEPFIEMTKQDFIMCSPREWG